jgi:hypothetical protein
MAGKKGGGLLEGLWTGTAFFAASNSKTFAGFVGNFLVYSLVLIIGFMLVAWALRLVTGKEMFSVAQIQCPSGSSPGKCPGTDTEGCVTPSGNCTASLNQ